MKGRQDRAAPISARFIEPMMCLAVNDLPAGPDWEYEVTLDGYRASRSAGGFI
jgi:ATP-dependent DNA ligase